MNGCEPQVLNITVDSQGYFGNGLVEVVVKREYIVRHAVHSSHQFFGEVTITNFKS